MVHVCHKILKGILRVLIPDLRVPNLHITKENLDDDYLLVSLEGILGGCCRLLTRNIYEVILILLLHEVVPHVLVGVLGCLQVGREQLPISILKCIVCFVEMWMFLS